MSVLLGFWNFFCYRLLRIDTYTFLISYLLSLFNTNISLCVICVVSAVKDEITNQVDQLLCLLSQSVLCPDTDPDSRICLSGGVLV